jgi:hypothetical protein
MPKLEFTDAELKSLFSDNYKGCFYDESVEHAEEMCVHADGLFPEKLIKERRPNEPQEVFDYREKIFVAKTKPVFSKIVSSLSKIRRSSDWSIKYGGDFPKIKEGETLEDYCEFYYPQFTSVTNWIYSVWLKKYLTDPNAVIFIYPEMLPTEGNEFLKPFTYIFDSCHVVDYVSEDYAVLKNPEGCVYNNSRNVNAEGKSFFVVTTERIQRYDQVDGRGTMSLVLDYAHNLGELPVYKIGAIIAKSQGSNYLYESRISGILPEFNEALREYSDLQAAKVLHIYPERWEYTNHECTSCKGTGRRPNPAFTPDCNCPQTLDCDTCSGKGYVVAGPYSKIMVKPAGMGETAPPTPPAGYVEKDIEIVKVQEESISKHIRDGLSSINFEFLAEGPLSQSGVAKEVDKDELNNTVHAIAEDMVRNMDWIYWVIAKYRYGLIYSDDEIAEMVPVIAVPEKYDILSSNHLQEQLKNAKDSKANAAIVNAIEIEYANKAFNSDPAIRDMVELVLSLDPLANIPEDDKMSRLSNKGITQETYVISSNIHSFVQRALDEHVGFADMDLPKQKEIILAYAQEQVSMDESVKVEIEPVEPEMPQEEPEDIDDLSEVDQIGKLPLAIQQLSLAAQRASDTGNVSLAARLNKKIDELLKSVGV